jgi:hypothetical protein
VILLQNSNESNLSPTKEGSSRKNDQGLKSKRGKTSFEKLHVSKREKKKRMNLLGEILSKNKERSSHFSYTSKSDVWPHPYPHIICI